MVKAFGLETEHFAVSHPRMKVHIIFRNPCPDNWASGGKKCISAEETLEFGQCHKVFSISRAGYEIKFLQSLQETYEMVVAFHIAGFAEHLLMNQKWRKMLEVLLKDGGKEEAVTELSQLAVTFVCINSRQKKEAFKRKFREELTEKRSNVAEVSVGGEAVDAFGLLVALMAALIARVILDNEEDSSDPDGPDEFSATSGDTADSSNDSIADLPSGVTLDSSMEHHGEPGNISSGVPSTADLPSGVTPVSREPETIGPESGEGGEFQKSFAEDQDDKAKNSERDASVVETSSNKSSDDPGEVSTPSVVTPDTSDGNIPEDHCDTKCVGSEIEEFVIVVEGESAELSYSAPVTPAAGRGRGGGFSEGLADEVGHVEADRPIKDVHSNDDPDKVSTPSVVTAEPRDGCRPEGHLKPETIGAESAERCQNDGMEGLTLGAVGEGGWSSEGQDKVRAPSLVTPGPGIAGKLEPDEVLGIGAPSLLDDSECPPQLSRDLAERSGDHGGDVSGPMKSRGSFPESSEPQELLSLDPGDRSRSSSPCEADPPGSRCKSLPSSDADPREATSSGGGESEQTAAIGQPAAEGHAFPMMATILVITMAMGNIPTWLQAVIGVVLIAVMLACWRP